MPIRVTVWHEFRHEKTSEVVRSIYPEGMHVTLKGALDRLLGNEAVVRTSTLDDPEQGFGDEVLQNTDVMVIWGHAANREVTDANGERVARRVREGMGLVVLHSAHLAKPFLKLMGTSGFLKWREAAEKTRIWNVLHGHPITAGLSKDYIELEHEEMYGEPFDIPTPDELVFVSWFEGGEVFRSGCVWRRGAGRIFYFQPGHETFPAYHNPDVQRVIANGVKYVAPAAGTLPMYKLCPNIVPPLSPISAEHKVDQSLHKH